MKSPLWLQMLADIFGREITVHPSEQASMLGAAALGLTALGAMVPQGTGSRWGRGRSSAPTRRTGCFTKKSMPATGKSYARVL